MTPPPRVVDLGRMPYAAAYEVQLQHHAEVLAAREVEGHGDECGEAGRLLLVEHDPPVITVNRRQGARNHMVASEQTLARLGVQVEETDRGGDITYHGPGQLVVYPILDLNRLRLRLHDYMRLLEAAVIDACATFGLAAERDACATGVWVRSEGEAAATDARRPEAAGGAAGTCIADPARTAKICAMGVRIRRWVTLHGLALNVTTNLDHFGLIVPCGLVGRSVTSLERELGPRRPPPAMATVKSAVCEALVRRLAAHLGRVEPGAVTAHGSDLVG